MILSYSRLPLRLLPHCSAHPLYSSTARMLLPKCYSLLAQLLNPPPDPFCNGHLSPSHHPPHSPPLLHLSPWLHPCVVANPLTTTTRGSQTPSYSSGVTPPTRPPFQTEIHSAICMDLAIVLPGATSRPYSHDVVSASLPPSLPCCPSP